MRTASTLAVCLLLFSPGLPAVAGDLAASLAARAAADVLGYVRIENPKSCLEKLDAISGRFGSRVSDDLPLIAQRFLKNPLLAGIEMGQPWTFIVLDAQRHTNNLAVVVGVSDAEVFCGSFGKGGVSNVKADPATASAAVRHFSETEEVYDHAAYVAALRAGKKVEPDQFKKQVTRHYYVTVRDGQGVIVGDKALLDKLVPSPAKLGQNRVRGDVAAAVRLPCVLPLCEKEIRQRKESTLEFIQTAAGISAAAKTPAQPDQFLNAAFDAALNIAKQVAWLEVAATLDGGRLTLRLAAPPTPGSEFSRALAGQQPLDLDEPLLALLPARVAVLGAARFVRTPEWTTFLTGMLQPVAGDTAAAREVTRALTDSWGDSFARAVLAPATNPPSIKLKGETTLAGKKATSFGCNIVEVFRVTHAAEARQAWRRAFEAGLMLEPAGKLKYENNAARQAGVEIDRITVDCAGAENAAGANFIQQVAFVGKLGLMAQGPDSTYSLRRLITAAQKPPAASRPPALKPAAASLPKKANGVFYMNPADYVALIRCASPAAAEDESLRRLQTQLAEVKVAPAAWLTLQPRAAAAELIVPLDTLLDFFFKSAGR